MDIKKEKESPESANEQRKIVRLPIFGQPFDSPEGSSPDEQKITNYLPESTKNTATGTKKLYAVQRPSIWLDTLNGGTEGRGIWYFNDFFISVVDSTVYFDTTATITLRSSTGMCGGVESSQNTFFFCDGLDGWIIYPDGSYLMVEESYLRWTANTEIEEGDKLIPTAYDAATANCYVYTASITSGDPTATTSGTQPTWPTTIGNTVVEGDITWKCSYKQNTMARKWKASHAYAVGNYVQPTTENSLYYMVTASDGAAGVTEPTWPLAINESVTLDGVTYECVGYYGGFPSPHVPTPVFMDGYIFLAEKDSVDIYNSGVFSLFSWSPLDFASAENFPDKVVALARQANFVVAFGTNSTELFYDAANEEGSPLSRNENYLLQVGLAYSTAIFQTEKYLMWVAKNPTGTHSVWSLNGYEAREVSTETIERFLYESDDPIYGFALRYNGHILFVMNRDTRTFVYDLEEELWTFWDIDIESGSSSFPVISVVRYPYSTTDQLVEGQGWNGDRYAFIISGFDVLPDDSVPGFSQYPVIGKIRFAKQDFGNSKHKFYHKAEVVGLFIDPGVGKDDNTYTLNWYDQEKSGSAVTGTVNLNLNQSDYRMYATRLGTSRRRNWELVTTSPNYANKLEALEITYTQGAS